MRGQGDLVGHSAGPVPNHLVHIDRQFLRDRAPPLRAGRLGVIPGELEPQALGRRALVGFGHVGQRHGLASVLFANRLVIRKVDPNRRHRTRITSLDDHFDRACGHARDLGLPEPRVPRHVILEPLRVRSQRVNAPRLLRVDVADHALPRPLDAARIEVDLDEPVDGIHR